MDVWSVGAIFAELLDGGATFFRADSESAVLNTVWTLWMDSDALASDVFVSDLFVSDLFVSDVFVSDVLTLPIVVTVL